MKKTLKYIFLLTALLVGFTGCVKEQWEIEKNNGEELPYPSDGKALIKFTVAVPGGYASTKANLADTPTIENMQVVVFGSSGFLKECAGIETFQSATTNGNTTLYTYQAKISITDSKNLKVHIIANLGNVKLPWKYDKEVLTKYAYTSNNQDAYWASFILPNGVTLKKEWDDETHSMVYVKDGDYYQVTDDVTDAFCGGTGRPGLPLVRNFAKISIQSTTPQFVLDKAKTLAVINKPDRGSVAPYNPQNGNIIYGYKDISYADMRADYPGYSPSGTQYIDTDPDATSLVWGTGTGDGEEIVSSVYMYERPVPAAGEPVSYMIVHGTFYPFKEKYYTDNQPNTWKATERSTPGTYLDLANGVPCYYKVDFKDDEGAYAIFRNFRYHIRITNVAKAGAETAGAAGSTGGTGDISQDQSVAGLTDFSDGYGRIAVSHTGWTFVEGRTEFELKYKFIEDAAQGDASANNALVSEGGPVTITIGAKTGPVNVISTTLDSSISSQTGTNVDAGDNGVIRVMGASTAKDAEGFRTIKFTVNTPDLHDVTTQTIHISGKVNETSTLSRDVIYYLMPRQNMIVECIADEVNPDYGVDYVEKTAGEGINVRITIPKMLPESMFPLVFSLESDALSITPNTAKYPEDNLPVANGNSICTGKESSKSFHYVRTLSYTEYQTLDETLDGMQFTCHFKTNKAESASKIYVDNQYFNKGNDSFYNYIMYNFRNLGFSNNSANANTPVNFTFYLDDDDTSRPRTVQVKLDGLLPQSTSGDWSVEDVDEGLYTYTIASGNNATLALKTISTAAGFDNTYSVTLNAYDDAATDIYHEASHGNVAQRITIDPASWTMEVGDKKTLTATVWPASTGSGDLSWTSSNSSVATVDGDGKVTAVGVGTANITASYGGTVSATCVITVEPTALHGISLANAKVGVGLTRTLVPSFTPSNATNKNIASWTSSDPTVATVTSAGVVRGVKAGTATITATSAEGGYQASCTVTVVAVTRVTLSVPTNNDNNWGSRTVTNGVGRAVFSSARRRYNDGYIRARAGYDVSFSTTNSKNIATIVINYTGGYYGDDVTPDSGSYSRTGAVGTWTPTTDTTSVVMNYDTEAHITSIDIYYYN
ncbi:MAG: Ig domain-containing protein [Bacteroidales bacterium]|nr:Ig domain-containing protein [Bacteroidales bacterium]